MHDVIRSISVTHWLYILLSTEPLMTIHWWEDLRASWKGQREGWRKKSRDQKVELVIRLFSDYALLMPLRASEAPRDNVGPCEGSLKPYLASWSHLRLSLWCPPSPSQASGVRTGIWNSPPPLSYSASAQRPKGLQWPIRNWNQISIYLLIRSSRIWTHWAAHEACSQDGRVVKALDLSSNGRMSAWVQTPLLAAFFL